MNEEKSRTFFFALFCFVFVFRSIRKQKEKFCRAQRDEILRFFHR